MADLIWRFETPNFTVVVEAEPEWDNPEDHFDDDEVVEGIKSGRFEWFSVHARVIDCLGRTIAADYLGCCTYESIKAFRDHLGIRQWEREISAREGRAVCVGSYFADMVREVCRQARETLRRDRERYAAIWLRTLR